MCRQTPATCRRSMNESSMCMQLWKVMSQIWTCGGGCMKCWAVYCSLIWKPGSQWKNWHPPFAEPCKQRFLHQNGSCQTTLKWLLYMPNINKSLTAAGSTVSILYHPPPAMPHQSDGIAAVHMAHTGDVVDQAGSITVDLQALAGLCYVVADTKHMLGLIISHDSNYLTEFGQTSLVTCMQVDKATTPVLLNPCFRVIFC